MTQSIEKQLAKILSSTAKMANGRTVKQNLEDAVDYLYECMDNEIRAFYALHTSGLYQRTFDIMDSLYAENFINARVNGHRIELSVGFRDSMAWHKSLFGDHKSYVPALINFGWNAPKLQNIMGRRIYRFTYYDGFHMVEKAVKHFNRTNTYGVYISPDDVEVTWNGKNVRKSEFEW